MSSSWTFEIESQAPAGPLFKAGFTDWHNLGPKLIPDIISSITLLSGHGEAGSTRQINFTPAVPFSFVKERLDFIDHEKLEIKITIVEGGHLGKKIESLTIHFKVEPKGHGSVIKLEETYKLIPGNDISEHFEKTKEGLARSIKAVEEFLQANPGAYA